MEIAIVSDEIVPEFREAVRYGTDWGIRKYELRTLTSGRVPGLNQIDVQQVLDGIRLDGIEITALSPGIFKVPLAQRKEIRRELDTILPQTIEIARKFGTGKIIIFGFKREQNEPDGNVAAVVEYLEEAAGIASSSGTSLLVENEPGYWCGSGKTTSEILRKVSDAPIKSNWDPCNAFGEDENPYPDGYSAIKDFIAGVHVKDTVKGALVECVPVGEGLIDWEGQLRSLVAERRIDYVTVETHSLPLIEKSKRNVDVLRSMLRAVEAR